jgi:hypothetical protein
MGIATQAVSHTGGVANFAVGNITTDGVAAVDTVINIGFAPRYFKWFEKGAPSAISFEWYEGMAANSCYRTVVAGDRTLDAAAGPAMGTPALGTGGTVTIKAADIPINKSFTWMAWG